MQRGWDGHWREYLMEAAQVGLFMVAACGLTVLLEHPASPLRQAIPDGLARRALMGLAMGATAVALIYSPWGRQSGAHLNPAVTLTFWRLRKVSTPDAVGYVAAQFLGAVGGVSVAGWLLAELAGHPSVNYAATVPGSAGIAAAFAAEAIISFNLMLVVLSASNSPGLARYTGIFAGVLVATFITIEAPLSGMSMNPARTTGSAVAARAWSVIWLYFTAPVVGMLVAAELYVRRWSLAGVACAKLSHQTARRCIFRCAYAEGALQSGSSGTTPTAISLRTAR